MEKNTSKPIQKKKKGSEVNILTFIKYARYRSSVNQRQAVVGIENTF